MKTSVTQILYRKSSQRKGSNNDVASMLFLLVAPRLAESIKKQGLANKIYSFLNVVHTGKYATITASSDCIEICIKMKTTLYCTSAVCHQWLIDIGCGSRRDTLEQVPKFPSSGNFKFPNFKFRELQVSK